MLKLAEYIFKNIVDNPDKVNISETTNEEGAVVLTATVAEEDMGKVIGKSGKVINAIRQVLKIAAIRQGKRVNLTLAEPEGAEKKAREPEPQQEEEIPTQEAAAPSSESNEEPVPAETEAESEKQKEK